MSLVELTTTGDGTLHLREAIHGVCGSCGTERDVAPVIVNHGDGRPLETLHVCGQCIAGALAVRFATEHVRAGGELSDLHGMAECERLLKARPDYSPGYGTPAVYECSCGRRFAYASEESEGASWQLITDPVTDTPETTTGGW